MNAIKLFNYYFSVNKLFLGLKAFCTKQRDKNGILLGNLRGGRDMNYVCCEQFK